MSETKYRMAIQYQDKGGPIIYVFSVMLDAWWSEEFNSNNEENRKNKLVSEYGKSVKIIVHAKGLAKSLETISKQSKSVKDVDVKIKIYRKSNSKKEEQIGDTSVKVKITNDIKEMITIPVNLKKGWCWEDRMWYKMDKHKEWYNYEEKKLIGQDITDLKEYIKKLKDELYFKVNIGSEAEEYRTFTKDDGYHLTAWPPPTLIMHAEAVIENFLDGGDIRPVPYKNNWQTQDANNKDNYKYWYRLVRAYKGYGLKGTQIIKYIYAKKGEIEYKIHEPIKVEGVKWNSGTNAKFEHPTVNIKIPSDVIYIEREKDYESFFFFKVPPKNDNGGDFAPGAHETDVFIHGTKSSKGCFLLGGPNGNPRDNKDKENPENKKALLIWDIMDQLLNKDYNNDKKLLDENKKPRKFEDGIVKITSAVTKDSATKLDFNYKGLEKTGKDDDADRKLEDYEKDDFNKPPARRLEDKEIRQFLIDHGKWKEIDFSWIVKKVEGAKK